MPVEPTDVYKVSHEIEAKGGALKTSCNLGGSTLATKSCRESCGLYFKSCTIVIYDHNHSMIIGPVLLKYDPS
jgi:hypothetical protein